MAHVESLRCRECGRTYDIAPLYTCERCFGPLEVAYDYDAIRAAISRESIAAGPPTIWRYAPLLPVDPPGEATLPIGWTPHRSAIISAQAPLAFAMIVAR